MQQQQQQQQQQRHQQAVDQRPVYQQPAGCHHVLSHGAILEKVLGLVPRSCLISTCSLVCTGWAALALSATASAEGSEEFAAWLQAHGSNLLELRVKGGSLRVCSSMAGLQQVTRLHLEGVTVLPALLRAVGDNMENLTHLRLHRVDWAHKSSTAITIELAAAASRLWEGCSGLTYLEATQCGFDNKCLWSLGPSLPHLRALDLSGNAIAKSDSFAGLPPGLTSLNLSHNPLDVTYLLDDGSRRYLHDYDVDGNTLDFVIAWDGEEDVSASTSLQMLPAFSGYFTELQVLDLSGLSLWRPNALHAHTMLTSLEMQDANIGIHGSLLEVLPELQQLRYLSIQEQHCSSESLRSLTQLTELKLSTREGAGTNQHSAGVRIFHGLRLPRLLQLWANDLRRPSANQLSPLFGGVAVEYMIDAFPALRELHLERSLQLTAAGAELDRLVALTGLTRLQLDALQQLQDWHMQSLAKLRGLSCLLVRGVGPHVTDRGIVALSALTDLTSLELSGVLSDGVSRALLPHSTSVLAPWYGSRGKPPGDTPKLQPKFTLACLWGLVKSWGVVALSTLTGLISLALTWVLAKRISMVVWPYSSGSAQKPPGDTLKLQPAFKFRPLAPAAVRHLKATVAEQLAVLGIRSPQTQRENRDMRRKARQDAYEAEQEVLARYYPKVALRQAVKAQRRAHEAQLAVQQAKEQQRQRQGCPESWQESAARFWQALRLEKEADCAQQRAVAAQQRAEAVLQRAAVKQTHAAAAQRRAASKQQRAAAEQRRAAVAQWRAAAAGQEVGALVWLELVVCYHCWRFVAGLIL